MNQPIITLLIPQEAADLLGIQLEELDGLCQTAKLTRFERPLGGHAKTTFYAKEQIQTALQDIAFVNLLDELCTRQATTLHVYKVGIEPHNALIEAPNGAAAAIYYAIYIANTDNPFAARVYTKDGLPWQGESYWLPWVLDHAHISLMLEHLKPKIAQCRLLQPGNTKPDRV